ncbi:uncharacterized protein LOC111369874 [Olea europaea var. sylvestris]|uniref:Uncharacterized protein n=1 Tax=Olea europaea subsp. europaea TaxID=158383 RepID=A0A8S0RDK8_OLEEU|nr:uncharacterized protein LOC111369874 [Olea europaea var. sylvestris]CAA2977022.1 Hypothetical predicted protein [Olea europaea subsp. europaea]
MATSMDSLSPSSLKQGSPSLMGSSSPIFSPSSDKRFWSTLRSRVDSLLENRKPIDQSSPVQMNDEATKRQKRLKEDSMLLLRGFDSVSQSLSQLSHNLENALQGAKDLSRPPTLTEILQATLEKARSEEYKSENENKDEEEAAKESEEIKRGSKRKSDSPECTQNKTEDSQNENAQSPKELGQLKKAKNLAISMATKASGLARELKMIKSDLRFMQERCSLLEEENSKLRDGFGKGVQPEEDDLVRLQLEALLAEKSRLASENANLKRENKCLNQLVEYHQLTSHDLSASYENLIRGMGLDFSSPDDDETNADCTDPRTDILGVSKSLDECYDEDL